MRTIFTVVLVLFGLLSLLLVAILGDEKLDVAAGLALISSAACWITLYRRAKQKPGSMNPLFTLVRTKIGRRYYELTFEWAHHDEIHVVNIRNLRTYFTDPDRKIFPQEINPTVWLCVTNTGQIIELDPMQQAAMQDYIRMGHFKAT